MKNRIYIIALLVLAGLTSCENDSWDFPDYEFQTVYFAYQYPIRTITLGEDIFDTTLDNEGKAVIMATTGGTYNNPQDVLIDVQVNNSLVDGLLFEENGSPVQAMPQSYYTLAADQIIIPKGELIGGVEFQLTDAFFEDEQAIGRNYVIPLEMTNVMSADSILSGVPLMAGARKPVAEDWDVVPKDFVLYAVKYVNPWHGNYLRRGVDVIEGTPGNEDLDDTVVRREEYVVDDEVTSLTTTALEDVSLDLVFQNSEGYAVNCTLILSFDDSGNCTVSAASEDYTASGSGQFVKDGEENSWGGKDRDALYLDYQVNLEEITVSTQDTLVLRDRGVTMETFSPVLE
ncbi:DUF1735 domain-containing protein [Zunongwangia sp. SCSIO 43204]|uniref:DUF5627 domain-containing protein n=1 Tax=Zunongwangia sp. SCSIO 43204 TaxID=2779359 RepID=UPI001CA87988|nr:DUF5627 domain-containing protein [Zunongwangia sp. SCSIO 43204]UAB85810.1 DUF1735 domain-containing protein [Zunongwangia sp. SCSIO 43204]